MRKTQAFVRADIAPNEEQEKALVAFLEKEYKRKIELVFECDETIKNGFILSYDGDIYDYSLKGRFRRLSKALKEELKDIPSDKLIPLMKSNIENWEADISSENIGTVRSVGDGISVVSGLKKAFYGEILSFSNGVRGMVRDLKKTKTGVECGCILFDDDTGISQGSRVFASGKVAGVPVGEELLGRVVDALGKPIDALGPIDAKEYKAIENDAPSIIDRAPVNVPMETGILTIDSMFPIGRGQRELIIGDRQTGKTTIAVDTILNQKGKDVICIYAAIGQKASSVHSIVDTLNKYGAMEYSVVVAACASDSSPLQYIAPYSATAIGEYFMEQGKDVLIVYDDLSKHAVAYRTISLLLGRSPGREAYPGDVFYLHSRLLERSAKLSNEKGGGSITALPIVETQAGDVSAYIPTNIISITDGQIFLESDLFFAGQRPAVNVGLSVSRVGGAAQAPIIKKAAGTLRLDLAQYREMEVFTKFSSDLDDDTSKRLNYGKGLMKLLCQSQHTPFSRHAEAIILICALNRLFMKIKLDEITKAASELIIHIEKTLPSICDNIENVGKLSGEEIQSITDEGTDFLSSYTGD